MMKSIADVHLEFMQTFCDNKDDKRLFTTFQNGRLDDEQLRTLGIDGVTSEIITFKSLQKLLSLMGLDFFKDAKKIGENSILYSPLKTRFEFQKNFYVGRKHQTTFVRIPLGEGHPNSLRNSLFVVFNSKEINDLSAKRKKGNFYYCKISLQGLHQPTRALNGKMLECFHLMMKRIKISELDIAADVKKRGKIMDHIAEIKSTTEELLETNIKVTTPKFVADVERSCYLNVIDKTSMVKNIKFYDKYKKQTEKYEEGIDPMFEKWHRIEITLRNFKGKYKDCSEKILLCLGRFIKILENSGIMPGVRINIDNMEILKAQFKVIKDLKFSKKMCFLPDYELYALEERHRLKAENAETQKKNDSYIVNKIIPNY